MQRLAMVVALVCIVPTLSQAQVPAVPANADTVEAYGLILIGGIDRFEYAPGEQIQPILLIINPTESAITVPGATSFCPMTFVQDVWCPTDGGECLEYGIGECSDDRATPIPPGTWHLEPYSYNQWAPGNGSWTHTSGRLRIWDPWTDLRQGWTAFELTVAFRRSPILGVQSIGWDQAKRLYR